MDHFIAKDHVRNDLSRNFPAAAGADIRIFHQMPVFPENLVKKWTGPFEVVYVDGKAVPVQIGGRVVQYSIEKVSKYHPEGGDGHETMEDGNRVLYPGDGAYVNDPHEEVIPTAMPESDF